MIWFSFEKLVYVLLVVFSAITAEIFLLMKFYNHLLYKIGYSRSGECSRILNDCLLHYKRLYEMTILVEDSRGLPNQFFGFGLGLCLLRLTRFLPPGLTVRSVRVKCQWGTEAIAHLLLLAACGAESLVYNGGQNRRQNSPDGKWNSDLNP